MTDAFSGHHAALDAPASHGFAVTPDDATDLAAATRALYVGTGGSIVATMLSGETVTFAMCPTAQSCRSGCGVFVQQAPRRLILSG